MNTPMDCDSNQSSSSQAVAPAPTNIADISSLQPPSKPSNDEATDSAATTPVIIGHVWNIKDFPQFRKPIQTCIPSTENSAKLGELELICYPFHEMSIMDNKKHVMCIVRFVSSKLNNVTAKYSISAVDGRGRKYFHRESHVCWRKGQNEFYGCWIVSRDSLLDPVHGILTFGKLKIFCVAKLIPNPGPSQSAIFYEKPKLLPNIAPEKKPCYLAEDMKSLLISEIYYDLILVSLEGEEFKVHKNILWARSRYFAEKLQDYEDGAEVETEIESELLNSLLEYIYFEKVDKCVLKAIAPELFIAAEKWKINDLKNICWKYLMENISLDTVIDFLMSADELDIEDLKIHCFEFIRQNYQQVVLLPNWKLLESHTLLFGELSMFIL